MVTAEDDTEVNEQYKKGDGWTDFLELICVFEHIRYNFI